MRYWWVNQNQTFVSEFQGGFLWSPKTRADGARNPFYDTMREVQPGDVVFSFCDTLIRAVGVAMRRAETAPKPDFGNIGLNWAAEGWLVEVEFHRLTQPIRPKDHIDELRPYLPPKYSPLQPNGNGVQSIYLTEVPEPLAYVLRALIGPQYGTVVRDLTEIDLSLAEPPPEPYVFEGRTDLKETTKVQLIRARNGQGVFRANVRLNETACRVTRVTDPKHLRASHIKPWAKADDTERLHGCNGLLLAPHVDHLFDDGFISFDQERLIISRHLEKSVLEKWSISPDVDVGKFNREQARFLEYHRDIVLRR
jgi:putative restriction endonuclease